MVSGPGPALIGLGVATLRVDPRGRAISQFCSLFGSLGTALRNHLLLRNNATVFGAKRPSLTPAILLMALLMTSVSPAFAKTKPGDTCKKAQQVKVVKNTSLKCVKVGKRLIWREVVSPPVVIPAAEVTPAPSPSPSSSPSAMPSPSPTSSPSPSPTPLDKNPNFTKILWSRLQPDSTYPISRETFTVPSTTPSSWSDIYETRDGISYKAWQSVAQEILVGSPRLGKVVVYQGPTTKSPFPDINSIMSLVSQAFSSAQQVSNTNVFIYNFSDRQWAHEKYQQIYRDESERFKYSNGNSVLDNCPVAREVCWAMAFTDSKYDGVMLLGVVESGSREHQGATFSAFARRDLGLVVAHEYFHTIQRKIIGENHFRMGGGPPSWFAEGTAVFVENAVVNHRSFDDYMRFRAVDSKLAYPGCEEWGGGCFKIDTETLNKFFQLSNYKNNWGDFPYGMKYEVSSRIIEILVALKGPNSIIKIYEEMAQNRTFEVAFERIYGIAYESATPIITKILTDQYANRK